VSKQLCISVTFLDSLFHGRGDGDEPEWAPSPLRLFQAMLAGARASCRQPGWSDAVADAFRWLENRHPPVIIAPDAKPCAPLTFFVPNNDGDRTFERQQRPSAKTAHAHRLAVVGDENGTGQTLHYLWPIPDEDVSTAAEHVRVLCREARHIIALGWGIDQVVADGRLLTDADAAALQGRRWEAWCNSAPVYRSWRVPVAGTLSDLQRAHAAFVQRVKREGRQMTFDPAAGVSRFASVTYLPSSTLPFRPFAAFELSEGCFFRQEEANAVAAMLRSLANRRAREDTHEFPGGSESYVAGHVGHNRFPPPPRFSYLPLPTIGHEHADGLIRRVLIAEPHGGDGSHAAWAAQRLRNQPLRDHDGNDRGLLLDLWRTASPAMVRRYVEPGRSWSSVTPVILPGYDDFDGGAARLARADGGRLTKAERLFLKSLAQAGIPAEAVAHITLRKAPFWPGSLHPRRYRRPHYLEDAHARPGWHVHLEFREPIPGPLAIGAGRHCGLGVFVRAEER